MEKILLFNVSDSDKIKRMVSPMHIQVTEIPAANCDDTLEALTRLKPNNVKIASAADYPFAGSLMLFCNVADKKMDKILFKLRQENISIMFKAVLTKINSGWTPRKLYLELTKEHIAFDSFSH